LGIDCHKVVSDNSDHGKSSEAVGQRVKCVVCDHLGGEAISLSVTTWQETSGNALCFLDDVEFGQGALVEWLHVIQGGGRKTSGRPFTASLYYTYHPFPSTFPPPLLPSFEYCSKMRPTAVLRGDAPTGTFRRRTSETPNLHCDLYRKSLGTFGDLPPTRITP